MSTKFKLGQRVTFRSYYYKSKSGQQTRWKRIEWVERIPSATGIVTGKRNVAEGHTEYYADYSEFIATRHLSFYLVATSLTTAYHVAEEDMEAINDNA